MNLERAATIAAETTLRKLHIHWKNKSTVVARVKGGFQSMVQEMVNRLEKMGANVRKHTKVCNVDRRDGSVKVQVQRVGEKDVETLEFDLLIIAFPQTVQNLSPIMKLTPAELEVFTGVVFNNYHTAAFGAAEKKEEDQKKANVLPSGGHCMVTADQKPVSFATLMNGQPMLALALDDWPLTVFYSLHSDPNFTEQQFDEATVKMFNKGFGYEYAEKPVYSQTWQYFPRFSPNDFVEKHNKLHDLQGKWGTFYTGSLCTFEVVERVVQYSRYLVNKFF